AATKAGLAEMEIADEEIDRIFAEIALRAEPDGQRQAGRRAELGIIAVTRALTPCLVTPSYA
ncbi:TraC family protein, partial [Shinella sp.]